MLYGVARFVLRPLSRALLRTRVSGQEHVPATGPVILASNHLSFIDSMVIPLSAPRRVRYLAKAEYFTTPGVGGSFTRTLFTALGALPVERETSRAARSAREAGRCGRPVGGQRLPGSPLPGGQASRRIVRISAGRAR